MVRQIILSSLLEIGVGFVALSVALVALDYRDKPAGWPLVVMSAAIAAWAFSNGLHSLVADPTLIWIFAHLRWPLALLAGIAWFYVAVEYTDRQWARSRALLVLFIGVWIAEVAIVATNHWHKQFVAAAEPLGETGYFIADPGPFFFGHIVVAFGLVLVGFGFFIRTYFHASGIYRKQIGAIVGSGTISLAFLVGQQLFRDLFAGLSLSIAGLTFLCVSLLWAMFRADFLETTPVARDILMDKMDSAIVAIDRDGKIIDANTPMETFMGNDEPLEGRQAADVFADYPPLLASIEEDDQIKDDLTLERNGREKHYQLAVTPITRSDTFARDGKTDLGRLIVLTDVTEQHRRQQELDLLKDVFSRVLRHNMRNDLNVIRGNVGILSDTLDDSEADLLETMAECTDDLLEMSEKARDLQTIIESPRSRERIDIGGAVGRAVSTVREEYPDATIRMDVQRGTEVIAHRNMETAIRNLIENACEHDDSPPTTVEIDSTDTDDAVELRIRDDGPGMPEIEQTVHQAESETSLEHSSGLGLWIVNWVIERSNATTHFETGDEGTTVTIRLETPGSASADYSASRATDASNASS